MKNKKGLFSTVVSVIIFILIIIVVSGAAYKDIDNRKIAKEVCLDNDGEWLANQAWGSKRCLIDNEIYQIIKVENGEWIPAK